MSSCIAIIAEKTVPDIIIIIRSSLILVKKDITWSHLFTFAVNTDLPGLIVVLRRYTFKTLFPSYISIFFLLSYVLHQLAFINGGVIL